MGWICNPILVRQTGAGLSEVDAFVLIRDTSDSLAVHFMNFVAGLFAFLIASHFIAAQLSRINAAILIVLFTAFSFITGAASLVRARAAGLALEQFVEHSGPQPTSLVATFSDTPTVPLFITALMVLGYAAGVIFFLQSRRSVAQTSE